MSAFYDTLRAPGWLWLLALLPVLAWWHHRAVPRAVMAEAAAWPRPRSFRERLVALPWLLELLGAALLVVALARPFATEPLPPERLGRSILLCLDRSSSMAAEDLVPGRTRLAVAKEVAAAFVGARGEDRVGCVEFARYADLRCPPTVDHAALAELLGDVALVPPDTAEDATGLGAAVALAATVLARAPEQGRVVVLLTDGDENVAVRGAPDEIAPEHAAQLCAQFGVRVHVVVVGSGRTRADGARAPLDTAAVAQLAAATGGRAFVAGDRAALQRAYAAIDALEAAPFAEPRWRVHEGFPLALALALLLWVLGRWLGATWLEVLP